MKRLSAYVNERFHRLVKAKAAEEGYTINDLIIELLRAWLKEKGIEVE